MQHYKRHKKTFKKYRKTVSRVLCDLINTIPNKTCKEITIQFVPKKIKKQLHHNPVRFYPIIELFSLVDKSITIANYQETENSDFK